MIYNTATIKKCSVSSVNLDSLVGGGTNAADSGSNSTSSTNSTSNATSFTWPVVLRKYKARDGSLEHVNLFVFCAQHMFTKEVIPQFFGFFDKPTWPLAEEWSRWMLTFYKPWLENTTKELMLDGSYAKHLEEFMWDDLFPKKITIKIQRCRHNWQFHAEAGEVFHGPGGVSATPTITDRTNDANDDAVAQAVTHDEAGYASDDERDGDLTEADFSSLDDGGDDVDWSDGLDETIPGKLKAYKDAFYSAQQLLAHTETNIELFDESKFRPENCKNDSQRLLVAHNILRLCEWKPHLEAWRDGVRSTMEIPDSHCAFVQGGPGTGKSFCINTDRNVTRQVFSSMRRDLATAPTGCAAQLINGVTGTRAFKMPVGKALLKPPTNLHVGDVEDCVRFNQQFLDLFSYTGDESSMEGRPIFAWRESRMWSSRSPYIHPDSTDEEEYDLIQAHLSPLRCMAARMVVFPLSASMVIVTSSRPSG
jgi:hypothetical protein